MTTKNDLVTDARAVRLSGGGFYAYFQSRSIGARYVRDAKGFPTVYESAIAAERAAWRGLARAIDERQPPRSAQAKAFKVFGSGRNRRAMPA